MYKWHSLQSGDGVHWNGTQHWNTQRITTQVQHFRFVQSKEQEVKLHPKTKQKKAFHFLKRCFSSATCTIAVAFPLILENVFSVETNPNPKYLAALRSTIVDNGEMHAKKILQTKTRKIKFGVCRLLNFFPVDRLAIGEARTARKSTYPLLLNLLYFPMALRSMSGQMPTKFKSDKNTPEINSKFTKFQKQTREFTPKTEHTMN